MQEIIWCSLDIYINEPRSDEMAKFFSKTKRRVKLAYRTPNWFRRIQKFSKSQPSKSKLNPPKTTKS